MAANPWSVRERVAPNQTTFSGYAAAEAGTHNRIRAII